MESQWVHEYGLGGIYAFLLLFFLSRPPPFLLYPPLPSSPQPPFFLFLFRYPFFRFFAFVSTVIHRLSRRFKKGIRSRGGKGARGGGGLKPTFRATVFFFSFSFLSRFRSKRPSRPVHARAHTPTTTTTPTTTEEVGETMLPPGPLFSPPFSSSSGRTRVARSLS